MGWIELYYKIQAIASIVGLALLGAFILFWIAVIIINKVMK